MKTRHLGQQGLEVSTLGLGCMSLSTYAYGPADKAESLKVLDRAIDLGINFFDTAELYGAYKNEELIGEWLKTQSRSSTIIATKFGFTWNAEGTPTGVNSRPEHIKRCIEGSLKRLQTDYIDLYYQHRLDPETPIEDTVGTLSDLVKEGKVRFIGLSEVGAATIRRAHAVHPITAVQSEYSLWEREVEDKVLPTLRELGIGFVPFSPLGRGFLSGKITDKTKFADNDFRNILERFNGENASHNYKMVEFLNELAAKNNVTPAQIALAWCLRQNDNIVPIPGTKHRQYLEENVGSVDLHMPAADWQALKEFINSFELAGQRYPEFIERLRDTTHT